MKKAQLLFFGLFINLFPSNKIQTDVNPKLYKIPGIFLVKLEGKVYKDFYFGLMSGGGIDSIFTIGGGFTYDTSKDIVNYFSVNYMYFLTTNQHSLSVDFIIKYFVVLRIILRQDGLFLSLGANFIEKFLSNKASVSINLSLIGHLISFSENIQNSVCQNNVNLDINSDLTVQNDSNNQSYSNFYTNAEMNSENQSDSENMNDKENRVIISQKEIQISKLSNFMHCLSLIFKKDEENKIVVTQNSIQISRFITTDYSNFINYLPVINEHYFVVSSIFSLILYNRILIPKFYFYIIPLPYFQFILIPRFISISLSIFSIMSSLFLNAQQRINLINVITNMPLIKTHSIKNIVIFGKKLKKIITNSFIENKNIMLLTYEEHNLNTNFFGILYKKIVISDLIMKSSNKLRINCVKSISLFSRVLSWIFLMHFYIYRFIIITCMQLIIFIDNQIKATNIYGLFMECMSYSLEKVAITNIYQLCATKLFFIFKIIKTTNCYQVIDLVLNPKVLKEE